MKNRIADFPAVVNTPNELVRHVSIHLRNWHSGVSEIDNVVADQVSNKLVEIISTLKKVASGAVKLEQVGLKDCDLKAIYLTLEYLQALTRSFRSIVESNHPDIADIELINSMKFFNAREIENQYIQPYHKYPKSVHLETQAICNAKCTFCPYTELSRKGEKMSMDSIYKIISDLERIPKSHNWILSPYKVNEPFLDERLDAILAMIYHRLHCSIHLISNGNFIPDKSLEALHRLDKAFPRRLKITFSLNTVNPTSYKELMKMNLEKTLANLDKLHKLAEQPESKNFLNRITLSTVATNVPETKEFYSFVQNRFPKFSVTIAHMNDWIGDVQSYESHSLTDQMTLNRGCGRWADLSITSTGDLALCCMDAQGNFELGNALKTNALDLYQKKQSILTNDDGFLKRRLDVTDDLPCSRCNYHQGGSYIYPSLGDVIDSMQYLATI